MKTFSSLISFQEKIDFAPQRDFSASIIALTPLYISQVSWTSENPSLLLLEISKIPSLDSECLNKE
jgi:hypothetical protein